MPAECTALSRYELNISSSLSRRYNTAYPVKCITRLTRLSV